MQDSSIDFIGIGAPRCGTTWLAECLRQHPDVLLPLRQGDPTSELGYQDLFDGKELCFFNASQSKTTYYVPPCNWHKGLDWYLHRFPPASPGKMRGEISPAYLHDPLSPELIKDTFPNVKLVVSLRNPVDMAYSLYRLHTYGRMNERFEELLDQGLYLEIGLYAKHLARYLERFPREQIHVILYDDISGRPEQVVQGLYRFLGVDAAFKPSVIGKKINTAQTVRSSTLKSFAVGTMGFLRNRARPLAARLAQQNGLIYRAYLKINHGGKPYETMRPETRTRLQAYFREDIEHLEKLIGRDLSAWKH